MHGLDRIDDEQRGGLALADRRQNVPDRSRRGEPNRSSAEAEAHRAKAHLLGGLLARNIDDLVSLAREPSGDLQQQRRLADPRIAAHQHGGACDNAAADRPVELRKPARQALRKRRGRFEADERDDTPAALKVVLRRKDARKLGALLHERVPLGAIRTLPLPTRRNGPAGLANIARLELPHVRNNTRTSL